MWCYRELVILLAVLVGLSWSRGPCDPLVPEYCQLPIPNSFFTRPDAESPTGVRVNFSADTFPKDAFGRGIDPVEWNALGASSDYTSWVHVHMYTDVSNTYMYMYTSIAWVELNVSCTHTHTHARTRIHTQMASPRSRPSWHSSRTSVTLTFHLTGIFNSLWIQTPQLY